LKEEIGKILEKEITFSGVLTTVTRTDTSPDLNQAKVYISVMPEDKKERVFDSLDKNVYNIQQQLNKRLRMRPVPKIKFKEEKKTEEAARIEEVLEEIKKEEK